MIDLEEFKENVKKYLHCCMIEVCPRTIIEIVEMAQAAESVINNCCKIINPSIIEKPDSIQLQWMVESICSEIKSKTEMLAMLQSKLDELEKQEPVAEVENSDYIHMSNKKKRPLAVRELFDGALVLGNLLYAKPIPAQQSSHEFMGFKIIENSQLKDGEMMAVMDNKEDV